MYTVGDVGDTGESGDGELTPAVAGSESGAGRVGDDVGMRGWELALRLAGPGDIGLDGVGGVDVSAWTGFMATALMTLRLLDPSDAGNSVDTLKLGSGLY